jgi:hypothetical protein
LQTQLYVNERADELSQGVLEALPSLAERRPTFRWVVPLAPNFLEPRDHVFLAALELVELSDELRRFWPKGGPVWDALAICEFEGGGRGYVLAEGKSYEGEMYAGGCRAGESGSERARENRAQIATALAWAQGRLGLRCDPEHWMSPLKQGDPTSSLFQTANRIAHTEWLRSHGHDAWLCHLLFVYDRSVRPTSGPEWLSGVDRADALLGTDEIDAPWIGHALLPALDAVTCLEGEA